MNVKEYTGKTVSDAITAATVDLGITSDRLKYEVVESGSNGFLGLFGAKPAVIRIIMEKSLVEKTKDFCDDIFRAMKVETSVSIDFNEEEKVMNIDLAGPNMGILIGNRGKTLDSLQYLISLFVNKGKDEYVRVKLDTEDYRRRRKETLENLAKGIAYKVKKTRKPVVLEPMNPYERRIIHSALQGNKFVETISEGEEPYRHIVVKMKRS